MTKEYGDWVTIPLDHYTERYRTDVRLHQEEQVDAAIKELVPEGKQHKVVWLPPKVIIAWRLEVEE